jgi:hypothetical protein
MLMATWQEISAQCCRQPMGWRPWKFAQAEDIAGNFEQASHASSF